jgi:hypothetical protein
MARQTEEKETPWLSVYPCVTRRPLEDDQTSISILELSVH